MSCEQIIKVNEGSSFSTMYRVKVDGAYITQAVTSSVKYAIINDDTKEVITALTSLVVANTIFDTLQTDSRWEEDNIGYNIKHDVAHTLMTDPDITYRLEYKLTLTSGSEHYLNPFIVKLNKIYSN